MQQPKTGALLEMGLAILVISGHSGQQEKKDKNAEKTDETTSPSAMVIDLPAPYPTKSSVSFSDVRGWPDDKAPVAPLGFIVSRFAAKPDTPLHLRGT